MKVIDHGNGIVEFADFVEKDTLNAIKSYLESLEESKWHDETDPENWSGRASKIYRYGDDAIVSIVESLELEIQKKLLNFTSINKICDFLRLREGQFLDLHVDNADEAEKTNVFGVVVYLNSEYEGGEIYYRSINYTIKPTAGSLLIHPAGLEHQVLAVTSGVRYMVTSFVKGDDTTEIVRH
jgi:predicted 2-oxoglutarate/Fe(II)-dependent dioxygenase YbiX